MDMYWNDQKIVTYFASMEPPKYWHDYFEDIQNKKETQVLDLGCGGGRNLCMLLEMQFDAYGCDLHKNMVLKTIENAEKVISKEKAEKRVVSADMINLPYESDSFHHVIASGVLHNAKNYTDYIKAIEQISRILRVDGTLCLNVFTAEDVDPSLIKKEEKGLYLTPDNLEMLLLDKSEVLVLLKKFGLVPVSEIVEYKSEVFNGYRSVMRGIFKKISLESNNVYKQFLHAANNNEENSAVLCNDEVYTYKQFAEDIINYSNFLCQYFKSEEKQLRIAIYMQRDYNLLLTIWSLIKQNNVYIPIDIKTPLERLNVILKDSKANYIITDDTNEKHLNGVEIIIINANNYDNKIIYKENIYKHNELFSYLLYTSGSSGSPKGVQVSCRALGYFINDFIKEIVFDPKSIILAHTSISFDISIVELVLMLTVGGTVVLCNDGQAGNFKSIIRLIKTKNITHLQITPSLLKLLLERIQPTDIEMIKALLVGGEQLTLTLLEKIKKVFKCPVYNLYGPTEATVWCSVSKLESIETPDIGNPFGSNCFLVIDENGDRIIEPNEKGELYIGGNQLADCYYGLNEMTLKSFPFIEGIRYYKTGDLVFRNEKGKLLFTGRCDHQIKINGNRVELEEIELCMENIPEISAAIIMVVNDELKDHIHCYFESKKIEDIDNIKEHLQKHLPAYMIPEKFIKVDKIPLLTSGKKDRNYYRKTNY